MGWLGNIFGSRKRREQRAEVLARLTDLYEGGGAERAWEPIVEALRADPEDEQLFHLAGQVLRSAGEPVTAELFDRAADAPHDPQRLFELGSELLTREQPEVAAVLLERALAFVPFDAVVRSELALAQARAGRPDMVIATLALHPCLGDDPGALFEFGWASLLTGDLEAAAGALGELHGAPSLRRKLQHALARAEHGEMEDARDYYFVEHAGVVLDAGGPLGGRYRTLEVDAARVAQWLADLGWLLEATVQRPRHVVAVSEARWALADAVARACGGAVLPTGATPPSRAIVPLLDAAEVESLDDGLPDDAVIVALTLEHGRSLSRAPAIVGAFARDARYGAALFDGPKATPSAELRAWFEARRALLPPRGPRVRAAWVPDAPLPR